MKKPRDVNRIVIQKMLDYCNDIESFISEFNGSFEVYQSKSSFRYSCDLCVIQIGELTTRLTDEFKAQHSEIPWRQVKNIRNMYAHEYEKVDFEQAWKILTEDIPALKVQLEKILATDESKLQWDADDWLKKFHADDVDYRAVRVDVWENTRAIVENGGYTLPNGEKVSLPNYEKYSRFYSEQFTASFERLTTAAEISVVTDDCLDAAHKWINDGLEVSVLNMANRRNPGGGVTFGAGAQEEYLFRCSNYFQFLYRYATYAAEYGLTRSRHQYPLDRNFGGIFSKGVTIFRENEETGYRLTAAPWKVNMIAVAGMNSPHLIFVDGEEKIAPNLVDGVKNKIRTIFRIACDNDQRNLILGALGCGAFHNPPKHVAELFREVLCEEEFFGAFQRICFAVKTSHSSRGDTNFSAFKEILDGFVPPLKDFP